MPQERTEGGVDAGQHGRDGFSGSRHGSGVNAEWARRRRWPLVAGGLVLLLIFAIAICEALGWPFLAGPMQRAMSRSLDRSVVFSAGPEGERAIRIHLLGGVQVSAGAIAIGAPDWSQDPYMVRADGARFALGYGDLWRARRGGALHVRELSAQRLDLKVQRLADGRASWQFGKPEAKTPASEPHWPSFGVLRVDDGRLILRDAIEPADIEAHFALNEGSLEPAWKEPVESPATTSAAASAPPLSASAAASAASVAARAASQLASSAAVQLAVQASAARAGASNAASSMAFEAPPKAASKVASNATSNVASRAMRNASAATAARAGGLVAGAPGLQLQASGHFRNLPLQVDLHTSGLMSLLAQGSALKEQPVRLTATVGHSHVSFSGATADPLHLQSVRGHISLAGPSLAAIGDPVGVTLPSTPPFETRGSIAKDGKVWKAQFDEAVIGTSRVRGAFTYDTSGQVPLLSGRLQGPKLALADLGPAIGAPPARNERREAPRQPGAKVLPERKFDLPSLRKMNANVLIDVDSFDLGTSLLEPLRPLRAHLQLTGGVLTVSDLDARAAEGRLAGNLQLDGRQPEAVWTADLRLLDVRLQSWLEQHRGKGEPPYLSGRLDTQIKVTGKGRSTAQILGSLDGSMRLHIRDGQVSHFAVELAGIDIADALGLVITGDKALPVACNVADLNVEHGLARARVFVLDTSASTIWITGGISLGTETMELIIYVSPKDFSPFTLRSPIHVSGTFAQPKISLEASKIGAQVGAAAALALLNPLAAVIPFLDTGAKATAHEEATQCRAVVERVKRAMAQASKPPIAPQGH